MGLAHELERRVRKLLVDSLHPLAGQGARILYFAVSKGVNHAARRKALTKGGVLGIEIGLRLLFRIEVIEVAQKLIKSMVGRQELILVAKMVLAKLACGVTQRLENLGNGRILRLQADLRTRHTHF